MFGDSGDPHPGAVRRQFVGSIMMDRLYRRQNDDSDRDSDDDDTPTQPSTSPLPLSPNPPPRITESGRLGLPPSGPAPVLTTSSLSSASTSEPFSTTAAVQTPITASGEPQRTTQTPAPPSSSTASSSTGFSSLTPTSSSTGSPGQGLPLSLPSTFSTATRRATSTIAIPTDSPVLGFPANPEGGQETPTVGSGGPQAGAKAGIAVGSIAAAALLVSLLFFFWRRFQARKSRMSALKPSHCEASGPTPLVQPTLTDAEILKDLMASARAHQNGGLIPDGSVVAGEKTGSLAVPNAEIRSSIANWLRRHHPLQLNPISGRNSMRSVSRCGSASPSSNPTTPRGPLAPSRSPLSSNSPQLSPLPAQASGQGGSRFQSVWSDTSAGSLPSNDDLSTVRDLTTGHQRSFPLRSSDSIC